MGPSPLLASNFPLEFEYYLLPAANLEMVVSLLITTEKFVLVNLMNGFHASLLKNYTIIPHFKIRLNLPDYINVRDSKRLNFLVGK